ncbi:MAG TPA: glycoside hydrolase family 2 TIM barrel-domain containing protein [Baekduia sp.]|uniref:glycoside hydrolase family 2 protein n=1 Tax=Baekduia sp. TaxID=2600305 RepID=UPI002BF6C7B3|nr:glycoside hydrolase family 2 TIM barrel-domain containing protein [Baekduia sp.]HMJ34189.1 glycoside hydrolase family 2 TIM barrel-domain containing protein [Baekduia sp.]
MSRTGTRLLVAGALGLAMLIAGAAVVAAVSSRPRGESLVPAAAYGGPAGRLAVAGPWIRALDPGDAGGLKGWGAGGFDGELVTVPDVANAAKVTGAAGEAAYRGGIAWYRTTLTAPSNGSFALRFESVHHEAEVWLDGRLLGTHTGAYLPFEFTLRLRAGVPHRLVVRADYRFPTRQKRDGWHRTWFNYGGINREVTLRPLPPSELEAPTLRTRLSRGAAIVDASVVVRNRSRRPRDLQVRGALRRARGGVGLVFPEVHLGGGELRRVSTRVVVQRPALWAPGSPSLYTMHLSAGRGEGAWDERVGLREVRRVGGTLLLNGKRLRLHGASLHEDAEGRGDALTGADMDGLVRDLRAIGANATRAQHALSPPLLERLDRAGILVWQGVGPVDAPGAWTSNTAGLGYAARERVRETVRQEQLHPSVIAWNLVNEIAGNGHDLTEIAYVRDMARELHERDPGRLVAVDLWGAHPPAVPGAIYRDVDAVALTNYIGWYEGATETKAHIASRLHDTAAGFAKLFAGKVLIVSEFGAEANAGNATAAPGGYGFQSWLLRRHIETYRALPQLSGMLVWNLRDFAVAPSFAGGSIKSIVPGIHIERGLNTKGIFDYAGRPKPAAATVRRAYAGLN